MPENSLHGNQVDYALEGFFSTDRYLYRAGVGTENVLKLTHYFKEVSAGAVHLVHVADTGYIVLVGLTPYCFALGFHTAYGAECGNSTVEHAQRALYFDSEVNVSRSVNKVDFVFVVVVLPECGSSGGGNCDTSFLFLLHPVHGSGAVVHLADFVRKACVEQDTFGGGSLAGVDVGHNADVAGIFKEFV